MSKQNLARIRSAMAEDASDIADIYNHFITETVVTFEVDAVTADEMNQRVTTVQTDSFPWLVAELGDRIVGYSYAAKWHARSAYRHSVETTVYLSPDSTGQGVGSALYAQLIDLLKERDVHTLIGGIALPNDASVALHEKYGFQKAAHYKEVGFKFDRWIDVGYWQRIL